MNDKEVDRMARTLAGVLRHFPDRFNLELDGHGWVDIDDFIQALRRKDPRLRWLRPHHLHALVDTDEKGRYQVMGNLIRATYGHSIDVELNHPSSNVPDKLYYPSSPEECDLLLETGLKPSDRKMVHLSKTWEIALNAGRYRMENPVVLEIDAKEAMEDGVDIQQAAKTVFLAYDIPAKFLRITDKDDVVQEEDAEENEEEDEGDV